MCAAGYLPCALNCTPSMSCHTCPHLLPPCSVDAVAKALVSAALDPSVPPGIMDVWEIGSKYG